MTQNTMAKYKLLVIDDEPQIRRFLRISLSANGHKVEEAENGTMGIRLAASLKPDIILLDLGLPDMDGQEVLKLIREWSKVPVIVVSVRADEIEKVTALDNGADDYMTKPFGIEELLARMRSVTRRSIEASSGNGETLIKAGDLEIDLMRRRVTLGGKQLKLSPKAYKLMHYFAMNPDRVLTHSQILSEVWGEAHKDDHQYLRVYIGQLRQKVEADPTNPTYITTEQGVGYIFVTNKEKTLPQQ